ncbi:MAG: fumarate hydratase [Clostridia bacterium]|nr:fumarate hydratase [Clostridia bacterium]
MKDIQASKIQEVIKDLCIQSNLHLPQDVEDALCCAYDAETFPRAKEVLGISKENLQIAKDKCMPICQDTGATCVYAEIGQDVHIVGDFEKAIQDGVVAGYTEGFLRKSIAADPIRRGNTGDNTPAFITTKIVPGDSLKLTVVPKGCGSENMSRLVMLTPGDGVDGVVQFVMDTVIKAGSNPCPPIVVGVGIGGTFDKVAWLAKKALMRPLNEKNPDPYYAELEEKLLKKINKTGIGPAGLGGKTTCLGVAIETMPTHVAGLPVAVNVSCHVTRRASIVL